MTDTYKAEISIFLYDIYLTRGAQTFDEWIITLEQTIAFSSKLNLQGLQIVSCWVTDYSQIFEIQI